MADDIDAEEVFSIEIGELIDPTQLNQQQIDELKYLEVPDEVWVQLKRDMERLPPLMPNTKPADIANQEENSNDRFKSVSMDELDQITCEANASSTKSQTRWALKVFTGKYDFS